MYKALLAKSIFSTLLVSLPLQQSLAHWDGSRPDSHAPIGVMGDHTHKKGEWMFSYRYMYMDMDGNRDGTSSISESEVLSQFMVAPRSMEMEMHMLGAMYAPSDNLTLMLMVPYLDTSMDHITRMGVKFETEATGLADIKFSGIYNLYSHHNEQTDIQHRMLLNLGLSIPTGDTDERDDTPAMANAKLPYPMQIGSGTYDLMPGITYLGQQITGHYSWGAQLMATLHTGENDEDYTRGDRFQLTGWVARKLNDRTSLSLRATALTWDEIDGADPDLNPMMVQTANTDLLQGDRLDLSVGLNYKVPGTGHRLGVELGAPVWQDLEGPQLETDLVLTVGWQWALH